MKSLALAAALLAGTAFLPAAPAQAAGCLKGAVVGGVAGHFMGHHGGVGAAAGCAIGHHRAAKNAQQDNNQNQSR